MKRSSGILLPISALPSPYGIGTLGKAARDFVDFLAEAEQSWWQILPLGPTSVGDSPYQSPSTFAGNPYYIDLDMLLEEGLLSQKEVEAAAWGRDPSRVSYDLLYQNRLPLLQKAVNRLWKEREAELNRFIEENRSWLPDYALFMALKQNFQMQSWQAWPEEPVRMRDAAALDTYREKRAIEIRLYAGIQYLFFRQWQELRAYAQAQRISILGDLPLYVALDSADVWAAPEFFLLDEARRPTAVAGVPPDYFSEEGQLWGNPLYDYQAMEQDGFGWWIRRIGGAEKLYDAIRIDHFRGWESFWAVPYGAASAREGHWIKGPGMRLVRVLQDWFPDLQFIAEDLGEASPELEQFLAESGFPGMKVLEFAFSAQEQSSYLPHAYTPHCICYAGTHDNDTLRGWMQEAPPEDVQKAMQYLGLQKKEDLPLGILRSGMRSVADLFIAQMQDYLGLGGEARMNTPGTVQGNWQWRMLPGQASPKLAKQIADMTKLYGRARTAS